MTSSLCTVLLSGKASLSFERGEMALALGLMGICTVFSFAVGASFSLLNGALQIVDTALSKLAWAFAVECKILSFDDSSEALWSARGVLCTSKQ